MVNDVTQTITLLIKTVTAPIAGVMNAINSVGEGITDVTDSSKKMAKGMREVGSQTRKLNWNLLSTLFLGMQLQRTMMSLVQPAFEAAGIFEIISAILEIFFLPIALALLDP